MKKRKTLAKLKLDCEEVCNRYIRLRDKDQPCISCGQFKILQAGHFHPVKGYDGLRFDEDNIHGECAGCNGFDQMHLLSYQDNLIVKIGEERFKALLTRAAEYKMNGYKFTRTELEEKILYYKGKCKDMQLNE